MKKICISIGMSMACLFAGKPSYAFSILTHEAIIDACWERSMVPVLRARFPKITDEELKKAHAYAYGGSIAPDMGYFPLGNVFYTNLVHYVRSGDFVTELLNDSRDVDEYAFALGFLSHYVTDKYGHSLATNKCVPIVYPEEKAKYGNTVTYAEDHLSHTRMEFGFDVLQTVEGNYASAAYHNFIGFQVSRGLLERAFRKIYGLDINDLFGNFPLSVMSFRLSFKKLFPTLTNAAWAIKQQNQMLGSGKLETSHPHLEGEMKKADKEDHHSKAGGKPGIAAHLISFLIRVLPKVGPLRALKFKDPGPAAEKLFVRSFDTILVEYRIVLNRCHSGHVELPNIDYDTGNLTAPGEYPLADKNYDMLVIRLKDQQFDQVNDSLRRNIIAFYGHRDKPHDPRDESHREMNVDKALARLAEPAHLSVRSSMDTK
ncbi:MAG: zinc dependent phospholipase C family protein [Bacteroidota bacterium]|nr:zinc dependent phospholipase C family protein [Bacteroidota bacterium]